MTKNDQQYYKCKECGFRYKDKEWAEKCEAWCKKHQSCNLEIIAHGMPPASPELQRGEPESDARENDSPKDEDHKFLTKLFYGLIGLVSSLVFFVVLYWALRLDSSLTNILTNTYSTPVYFWPYVILTIGTIVLFGVNISLLVYRWRKYGPPKIRRETGGGAGTLLGIVASACPVCGSTILAALGIAGGLAAFPLQGLELKALSFGLMALPVWLTRRELKRWGCDEGLCPTPRDHSFKERDKSWLTILGALAIVFLFASWSMLKTEPIIAKALSLNQIVNPNDNKLNALNTSATGNKLYDDVAVKVLPENGFKSKIALGDSAVRLVELGVIDRQKFEVIYRERGGLPGEFKDALAKPVSKPILLTRENANYYVNLLWPIGLANYMSTNEKSPVKGDSLFNFASTGGWDLGKEKNGGAYFNKLKIVKLTPEQEALATKIAQNTFRPCCNNSTFFQDCNHGSALLGLLELGAAQGLTEEELYREALAFNSFWFPDTYIQTALYFRVVKGIEWENVDPKIIMSEDYSSISGWSKNVQPEIAKRPNLLPQTKEGASCGV